MTSTTSPSGIPPDNCRTRLAGALETSHRVAYALLVVAVCLSSGWDSGVFVMAPIWGFQTGSRAYQIGAVSLLAPVVVVGWLGALVVGHRRLRLTLGPWRIALPVLAFSTWTLARIWPVHSIHVAIVTMLAIVLLLANYLYALNAWSKGWLAGTFVFLLVLQGTLALVQFISQRSVGLHFLGEATLTPEGQGISVVHGMGRRWLRAYGLAPHPNALGGLLSLWLSACLGGVLDSELLARLSQAATWLARAAILVGVAGLFCTFSRSAWLGTAAGMTYYLAIVRPWHSLDLRDRRTRVWLAVAAGLVLVFVVIIGALYGDLLVTRFLRPDDPLEKASLRERRIDVGQAWLLIRNVPLLGTGPGYYIGALWATVGNNLGPGYEGFRAVHNVPLLAAAEMGVLGLLLWCWLLVGPAVAVTRRRNLGAFWRAGLGGACVAAFVMSFFDVYLYIPVTWWPAVVLGTVCGALARDLGESSGLPTEEDDAL